MSFLLLRSLSKSLPFGCLFSVSQVLALPTRTRTLLSRIASLRQQINAQRDADPTVAYQQRLAQIRASGGGGTQPPQLLQASADSNSLDPFGRVGQGDRWRLESRPEAPRSPYELRAGAVLPATLISGINADLPGQIIAQISQHVYDTPTGRHLLIPQGSRLIGAYSSDVAYGQARVMVAWQRIVYPDGYAMDIGAMPGADGAGYTGFGDQVDNHYTKLIVGAFLMSGVTAGVTYSQRQGQNNYNTADASSAMSEALGQQLGQVTAQMIEKNLSVSPTLEIRPGYRFNVLVVKDLTFEVPYGSEH
jgi:type IV secretion system protein VirB10